jgi:hypothetical protein
MPEAVRFLLEKAETAAVVKARFAELDARRAAVEGALSSVTFDSDPAEVGALEVELMGLGRVLAARPRVAESSGELHRQAAESVAEVRALLREYRSEATLLRGAVSSLEREITAEEEGRPRRLPQSVMPRRSLSMLRAECRGKAEELQAVESAIAAAEAALREVEESGLAV